MSQVSILWRQNVAEPVKSVSITNYSAKNLNIDESTGETSSKRDYVSGYLKIKTNRTMFGKRVWDKWWFVVDIAHGQMCWYKNKSSRVPAGFLRLESIKRVKLMNQKEYEGRITLRLRGNSTKMELLCDDSNDVERWVKGIRNAMENSLPETQLICIASGNRVLAYAVQILYEPVKNPSPELAYAMTLVPQVAHSTMAVVGECTDRINGLELPTMSMRTKMLISQLLRPNEFLVGVASADQSVKLFRWEVNAVDEEEEDERENHEEEILDWATYQKLLDRDIATEDRVLNNPLEYDMPVRPMSEDTKFAWVSLERPMTQHQLTLRVEQDLKLRESKIEEKQIAPETTILGQPRLHNVSALKLYRDNDLSDDDSEIVLNPNDLNGGLEEDEYEVMNDLSRRLLGAAAPEKASKPIVMAQANIREEHESEATKILKNNANDDYFLSDDDADSDDDNAGHQKRVRPKATDEAVLHGKDYDEGKLATFARMAENKEKQAYGNDRTCNADCVIM